MKKKWTYNYQKGLKNALVSFDMLRLEDDLFFVLHYGISNWESVLIKLNVRTQESQVIFRENHVMRSVGAFEQDRFYFTTFKGIAYCIDTSGKIIWQTNIGGQNAAAQVLVDGDRVYVSDFALYCLEKDTGHVLWINKGQGEKTNCSFAVNGRYLYHAELGGVIQCIDKISGETIWQYGKELWISQCILLNENCLMACHIHGKFLFLHAQTGELIKEVKAEGILYRRPVFYNGNMYIGNGNSVINSTGGTMTCYNIKEDYDLEEVFSISTKGAISTDAVIDGECLYFASEDGYLYCVNNETGSEINKKKKTAGVCRSILIVDDQIIISSDKGQIECFEK